MPEGPWVFWRRILPGWTRANDLVQRPAAQRTGTPHNAGRSMLARINAAPVTRPVCLPAR